jgi:uncharacterized protein YgiM (DUF1202 family)
MKRNFWLVLGLMLSMSLPAQQVTNEPAAAPIESPAPAPAVTNAAPAKASSAATAKKSTKKKKAPSTKAPGKKPATTYQLKTVPLVPGPAAVVANHVNVRGQPKLKSEVVARLSKGDQVTVIEEITRNTGPDEPSAWAKIVLPPSAHVWVNAGFIDPSAKTVVPRRLNLRSGPGENYSVIGRLQRGESVKELTVKGDWIEIEAPTNAYAFMAAQYLSQEKAPPVVASTTPAAPTTPAESTSVAEAPAVTSANTNAPETATPGTNAPAEVAANTATQPGGETNAAAVTATEPETETETEEPLPPRIVQREGIVRGTVSIQAPTHFELISPENNKVIDYLYTSSPELDLRRYKGLRIIVTGEEGLDERWRNTPVLTIQRIQVID